MSDYSQSSTAPRTPSARLMAPASLSVTVLIITMDTSVFERSVWQSMESESIPPPREYVSIWFVLCCYVYRGNSQPCRYLGLLELPRLCSLSCSGSHRDVRPKPCELQMSGFYLYLSRNWLLWDGGNADSRAWEEPLLLLFFNHWRAVVFYFQSDRLILPLVLGIVFPHFKCFLFCFVFLAEPLFTVLCIFNWEENKFCSPSCALCQQNTDLVYSRQFHLEISRGGL